MNLDTITAIGLAITLVGVGVAGALPDHAGAPNAESGHEHGPADTLPDPVPSFVSQIHEAIRGFLAGGLDGSLGEAISSIAGVGVPAAGAG